LVALLLQMANEQGINMAPRGIPASIETMLKCAATPNALSSDLSLSILRTANFARARPGL